MFPAETRWAVQALGDARDRLAAGQEILVPGETWALDARALFSATAESLMWVVMLDDWYRRDHFHAYEQLRPEMHTLLAGLRWARNRSLHQFAVLTGFTRRPPALSHIHPGWQHRSVLPPSDVRFDRGNVQYDARVAGRTLLEPLDEVYQWFLDWVEIELRRADAGAERP